MSHLAFMIDNRVDNRHQIRLVTLSTGDNSRLDARSRIKIITVCSIWFLISSCVDSRNFLLPTTMTSYISTECHDNYVVVINSYRFFTNHAFILQLFSIGLRIRIANLLFKLITCVLYIFRVVTDLDPMSSSWWVGASLHLQLNELRVKASLRDNEWAVERRVMTTIKVEPLIDTFMEPLTEYNWLEWDIRRYSLLSLL